MAWKIEISRRARKNLRSLDKQNAQRLLIFLHERIAPLEDARSIGHPLKGARLGELWRYRVGDYRIIASIEDESLRILVVRLGHRRDIYKEK